VTTPLDWIMPAASTFTVPAAPPLSGEMTNRGPLDQSGLPVAKSLCHLLRLIVSAPVEARAPLQAVQRLRPVVDRRRLELQTILESSGAIKEYERGQEQLLHSAVAGLCHIARFCIDDSPDSTVPSFAAAAINQRSRRQLAPLVPAVLFVVSESALARQRAYRMVTFVLIGLSDLGFAVHCGSCTPSSAASLGDTFPGTPVTMRDLRLVWGCFSLYDDLVRRLPGSASELHIQRPYLTKGIPESVAA
jgi:hypothetical protein